ncbi:HNH endonuclease [Mesorhizobium sp. CAU 1732]|uniref:HNH endonuclease n=1 Tax=Mesorhizobium sp. CAU 1732 TaxID=3140358 RepID=UPI0032607285
MTAHRSPEAAAYHRWYGLKAWKVAREAQLSGQPLCERCLQSEDVTAAAVVNHRIPHKGDWGLFIDPGNHESICAPHHDSLVRREEKRGYVVGSDINGRPVDPLHPWNQ